MKIFLIINYLFINFTIFSQDWIYTGMDIDAFPECITLYDSTEFWLIGNKISSDSAFVYKYMGVNSGGEIIKLPYRDFMYGRSFTCIAAHDSSQAWVGTDDGRIYYTTNGGYNWNLQVNAGGQGFINDIKFSLTNPNIGYANSDPPNGPGTPFMIFKTTDGGFNWTSYSFSTNAQPYGAIRVSCVTDSEHYWMGLACMPPYNCTNPPAIAFTTNGGINWIIKNVPGTSLYVTSLVFKSDNMTGFSSTWSMPPVNIFKSNNGGANWVYNFLTPYNEPITSFVWAEGTSCWYYSTMGEGDSIYRTTNDGLTWANMFTDNWNDQFMHMDVKRFSHHIFGYAVTTSKRIYQMDYDSAILIGINKISNKVPNYFKLYQNYPNPFNPKTTINFDIKKSESIKIIVYDIMGREIETLVNESDGSRLNTGSYSIEWDGSKYASGVYIYKMITDGFTETRRMVLVK